jgi:hypothetical protein
MNDMGFKARKLKKGLFEVLGVEEYVDRKVAELKRALGGKAQSKAAPLTAKRPAARKGKVATRSDAGLDQLLAALARHPRRAQLVSVGKQKDQLLRSLIPLYLARSTPLDVSSGLISRFWKLHGVTYAAPNAAKALREHVGYARVVKGARQITPNGIKYVESAVQRLAA